MREKDIAYYAQVLIKGNYFPYYEKRFSEWLDNDGDYDKLKLYIAMALDKSERTVAIDVGANVGLLTRLLADYYEYVLAIEPSSQNRACIYRNMKPASNNIIVLPFAAGKQNIKSVLRINMINCGGSAIDSNYCDSNALEKIEIRTIDDMALAAPNQDNISLIKIDIQGGEYDALAGATRTITRSRPIIICEVNSSINDDDPRILKFMHEIDYLHYLPIGKDRIYIPREKITKSIIKEFKKIRNVIFDGFRTEAEYHSMCEAMRLKLDVKPEVVRHLDNHND